MIFTVIVLGVVGAVAYGIYKAKKAFTAGNVVAQVKADVPVVEAAVEKVVDDAKKTIEPVSQGPTSV